MQENVTKPSDVNNIERTEMAQVAQYISEMSFPTVGGTADALTLTPTTALAAYADDVVYTGTIGSSANATTTPTLNISALGAVVIRKMSGGADIAVAAGDLAAQTQYTFVYKTAANSGAGAWIVVGGAGITLATGMATFLATPTSANLATAVTDELGTGLLVFSSALTGFRNSLINGAPLVWQRGTSFAISSSTPVYTADRWAASVSAGTVAITAAQEVAPATGVPFSLRVQRNSANTNTNAIRATQVIESINCVRLQGQTVTLSFYAKVGANFSAASSVLVSAIYTGTGSNQGLTSLIAGTWTGQATTSTKNNTATTSRQQFTQSVTIPTTATEIAIDIAFTPIGTASTNDWFEIDSLQLEVGSIATPLEQRSIAVETNICQRYFSYPQIGFGKYTAATTVELFIDAPIIMRATPTIILGTPNQISEIGVSDRAVTSIGSTFSSSSSGWHGALTMTASGTTGDLAAITYGTPFLFTAEL